MDKSCEKWQRVVRSGGKVGKSGEKRRKVGKSDEKRRKVA